MKTNFMGKCYAGMNSMVTGMKRSNLNWKQDGKAAEAEKTIHTMTREIGNLTVVMLDGDRSVGPDIKERYYAHLRLAPLMGAGMVGTETLLMAMYEEPEWVTDMFERELELSLKLLERVWDAGYTFDELHWYDDMGYKNTQFFSLQMYRELLKPYHQRAIDWGHAHGCVVRLHSCGNIMPLVPELVSMGLDGLNPLEVKAGMKPEQLKKEFGDRLLFHGGFNVVEWDKPEIILPEIERLVPILKENGGYIFASDHSIPPHVSFRDFSDIIAAVKRVGSYGGKRE